MGISGRGHEANFIDPVSHAVLAAVAKGLQFTRYCVDYDMTIKVSPPGIQPHACVCIFPLVSLRTSIVAELHSCSQTTNYAFVNDLETCC